MKVELSLLDPDTGRPGWIRRYWIDVERGAHPIRMEGLDDGRLITLASEIELARFEANDGKVFWFPAKGRLQGFGRGWERPSPTPMSDQTFEVLKGYPRLNQGLPDARFTLDWDRKPAPTLKTEPKVHAKPVSAQERLVTALDQADKQAGGVEAGSPAREGWLARRWGSVVLGLFGVVVFVTVAVMKRRAG